MCWTKYKLANCTGSPARPPYQKVETWLQDRAWNQPSRYWLLKIIWKVILDFFAKMQCMRLCICSDNLFEESYEDSLWRKIAQMQNMQLWICSDSVFEESFETIWRQIAQMQCMRLWLYMRLKIAKMQWMQYPGEPALQVLKGADLKHLRPHIETLGGQVL